MRNLALLVAVAFLGCVPAAAPSSFRLQAGPVASAIRSATIGPIYAEELEEPARALMEAPPVIVFTIDSPGGSVQVGLQFVDMMKAAQAKGSHITCIVDGMAASMAGYVLEACDVRLMKRQSSLMFHTVSVSGAEGNAWELERLSKQMASWNKMLAIFISGRMTISLAEYELRTHDTDYWVGWQEAIEIGAVDGVL